MHKEDQMTEFKFIRKKRKKKRAKTFTNLEFSDQYSLTTDNADNKCIFNPIRKLIFKNCSSSIFDPI